MSFVGLSEVDMEEQPPTSSPLHCMTSAMGFPHYIAPEIISQNNEDGKKAKRKNGPGYDGTKADVWSAVVILYKMLFHLPSFGRDLNYQV